MVAAKPLHECEKRAMHVTFCSSGLFDQVMTAMASILATTASPELVYFHLIADKNILNEIRGYFGDALYMPGADYPRGGPAFPEVDDPAEWAMTLLEISKRATKWLRVATTVYLATPNIQAYVFDSDKYTHLIRTPSEKRLGNALNYAR